MINWGIVGCGEIAGKRVADAIKQAKNCCLKAVARRDVRKAEEFARLHSVEKYYTDAELMLQDSDIHAVYISTPVYLHHKYTLLAAQYKKHVLCEKPMAMNARQCKEMIDACGNHGVQLGVAYYRRLYPKILKMKQMIDEGAIGRIVFARAQFTESLGSMDAIGGNWIIDPEKAGGGTLMDIGCHMLDLLCYCLGNPLYVTAFTDNIFNKYKVEDTASLMIRFENGCHGVLNCSFSVPGGNQIEIFGTEGKIMMDSVDDDRAFLIDMKNNIKSYLLPRHANVNIPLLEDFTAAVEQNETPAITGYHGMLVASVIEAAYKSSESGEVCKINDYI